MRTYFGEAEMEAINYSEFRKNMAKTIDRVNEDHAPILITRQNGKPAVLVSLEDYNALDETAYLIASPANKARLEQAVSDIKAGKIEERDLIEVDD